MRAQRSVFLSVICGTLLFGACSQKTKSDFHSDQLQQNKYASYFHIYSKPDCNILVTYLATEKTDSAIYVIYKNEKPDAGAGAYYIKSPVANVACLSSVFVGFISRLGVIKKVRAVDNMDFIWDPELQYLAAEGSVKQLARSGSLSIEETLISGVQVVLANPGGDKRKDFDERLLKAGIIPVVCADYFENHPLGRAEWIKVLGLFFCMEKQADSLFTETEKKYFSVKSAADTCMYKPSVLTEVKTNDTWFVAGGRSFQAQLLKDAGADYIWKDIDKTSGIPFSMEQVMQKALDAGFWINLHFFNKAKELEQADERYTKFKAFQSGNLFNNNARLNPKGGNDYWEDGLCSPDEILADLVKIFHPLVMPDHKLKYYKQLQ